MTGKEIFEIENTRPHVVILGAGATVATIPNGDKYGNPCSVMHGFIHNLGLDTILASVKLNTKSENIEDIYSELYERGDECKSVREQLEDAIFTYFSRLELPNEITVYDELILALTQKDMIATFNWDPLLIQAYNRARKLTTNLPKLAFLHGNVATGYCEQCGHFGALQRVKCDNCGTVYRRSPLLFPVKHKDYNSNPFIKQQWIILNEFLSRAKMITIFGYSAPKTEVEAAQMLKSAFEKYLPAQRFSHIDIIERPNFEHENLSNVWREFINDSNCNYHIHDSFYESYLANSPRRSVECFYKRNMTGWWGDSTIKFKKEDSWNDIKERIMFLLAEEKEGKKVLDVNPISPKELIDELIQLDKDSQMLAEDVFYKKYENANFKCAFRNPVSINNLAFYRSRMAAKIGKDEDLTLPSTFSYVPIEKSDVISRGRMNKKGQSMFYASLSPDTNYREICHDIKEGDEVYLSKWGMKLDSSMMVLPVYLPQNIKVNADLSNYLGINNTFFTEGLMGKYIKKFNELFTRTEEDENRRYLCSSFLANYIFKQSGSVEYKNQELKYKFEGIIYPSARIGDGKIRFTNIVIPPSVVNDKMELIYVVRGKLKEDLCSITADAFGFYKNGKIRWYELKTFSENVTINSIFVVDDNGNSLDLNGHKCTDKDGNVVHEKDIAKIIKYKLCDKILEHATYNNMFENSVSYSNANSEDNLVKTIQLVCVWPVDGWHVDKGILLKHIQFEIEIAEELSEIKM